MEKDNQELKRIVKEQKEIIVALKKSIKAQENVIKQQKYIIEQQKKMLENKEHNNNKHNNSKHNNNSGFNDTDLKRLSMSKNRNYKIVKIKENRKCSICNKVFKAGTQMLTISKKGEGRSWTCGKCYNTKINEVAESWMNDIDEVEYYDPYFVEDIDYDDGYSSNGN